MDNTTELKKAFEGIDRDMLAAALQRMKDGKHTKSVCSRNYIDQVVSGHVKPSAKRARHIEKATLGRVPAKLLRPDIFGD